MGSVVKGLAAPLTGGLSLVPGASDIGKSIFGDSGSNAALYSQNNPALQAIDQRSQGQTSPELQKILQDYSTGGMSLSDAISKAGGISGGTDRLATDPLTGSVMASDQVRSNPLTSGIFGQGGVQDQAQSQYGKLGDYLDQDRNALMGRDQSYGLTNQDLAAYGQASGNIGRMFANQEQSLAQSLADRGLAAAPSGVAGQAFSGLMGNKLEQLAGLQQQISQNRINTAQQLAQARNQADLQRQSQTGSLIQGLGNLGQQAVNDQFGRQLAGSENNYNQTAGAAGLNLQNQGLQQNIANSQFAQQQATRTPSLGESIGTGINQGIGGGISKGITNALGGTSPGANGQAGSLGLIGKAAGG